jgi:hypothetical protein
VTNVVSYKKMTSLSSGGGGGSEGPTCTDTVRNLIWLLDTASTDPMSAKFAARELMQTTACDKEVPRLIHVRSVYTIQCSRMGHSDLSRKLTTGAPLSVDETRVAMEALMHTRAYCTRELVQALPLWHRMFYHTVGRSEWLLIRMGFWVHHR